MTKTGIQMYDKNTYNAAVCPPILLLSSEWGLNRQPSGYWTTTLTTAPRLTQIQKHAYKCMKKGIQTIIQIYEKTSIQTRIQMYEKNTHTNV